MAITEEDKIPAVQEAQRIIDESKNKHKSSLINKIFRRTGSERFSNLEITNTGSNHKDTMFNSAVFAIWVFSMSLGQDMAFSTFSQSADSFPIRLIYNYQPILLFTICEAILLERPIRQICSGIFLNQKFKL